MATAALLQSQKKALRKAVSATLRALPPVDVHTQSRAIAERILSSRFFEESRSISCYLSMPTAEADTSQLVPEILSSGKTLYVPKVDLSTEGRMEFLKVYGPEDLESFPAGLWGIREPTGYWKDQKRMSAMDADSDPLDVILLPGIAFDRSMSRLGHGKGYYDRFISSYAAFAESQGRKRPLLVALALRQQVLEESVPSGEHDWKVDLIISPDEVLGRSSLV